MWTDSAVFVLICLNINCVFAFTNNRNYTDVEQKSVNRSSSNKLINDNQTHTNYSVENAFNNSTTHERQKRQASSGAGKFTEAANVDQIKILRLYLQLFKNLWSKNYIGGAHPMHPDVPKPVIYLFKQRIIEFFFPPVGEDAIKDK